MKINKVLIDIVTQEKILFKHGIKIEEIENALLEGNARFFIIKRSLYMAVAHYDRYITIIFEYNKQNAIVKTAYPSSDWQIRRYKRK